MAASEDIETIEQIIDEAVWERYGGGEDEDWHVGWDVRQRLHAAGYRIVSEEDLAEVKRRIDALSIKIGGNP